MVVRPCNISYSVMWDVSLYALNVLLPMLNKEDALVKSQADASRAGEARYEVASHEP